MNASSKSSLMFFVSPTVARDTGEAAAGDDSEQQTLLAKGDEEAVPASTVEVAA